MNATQLSQIALNESNNFRKVLSREQSNNTAYAYIANWLYSQDSGNNPEKILEVFRDAMDMLNLVLNRGQE